MELSQILKDAGIVGAGGAGFPSYAKLAEGADTLLINGSECEPLLYTDYMILKYELSSVVEGAELVIGAMGIRGCVLAIKKHTAKRLCLEDGARLSERVTVKVLPDVYPIGDEVSLVYQSLGRIIRPGNLPITVGVIVFNVETVYNCYHAIKHARPVTEKWLTVGGDIKSPCVLRTPIGARVDSLLSGLGIKLDEGHVLIDGGPSMGKLVDPATATVTKTTKALLILPEHIEAVRSKRINQTAAVARAETACCQCTRCTDMCPRFLLGYPLEPHKMVRTAMGAVKVSPEMVISATLCCGCGICESLACSQGISPKAVINNYKALLASNKMKYKADVDSVARHERDWRQIPSERWASALGVNRFDTVPEYIGWRDVDRVELSLTGHIGAPSVLSVKDGDLVGKGELVATANQGLSIPQHSPFGGRVSLASKKIIIDKVDRNV